MKVIESREIIGDDEEEETETEADAKKKRKRTSDEANNILSHRDHRSAKEGSVVRVSMLVRETPNLHFYQTYLAY